MTKNVLVVLLTLISVSFVPSKGALLANQKNTKYVSDTTEVSDPEVRHVKKTDYNPFGKNSSIEISLTDAASEFCYPIDGKFSSGYGRRGRRHHSGVDLIAPKNSSIVAAFDGEVRMSQKYYGYGNMIVLRHSNGLETVYSHCDKNLVSLGDIVKAGDQIALCGRTGRATTNHLHFEVRIMGKTIDPLLLIDAQNRKINEGYLVIKKAGNNTISAKLNSTPGQHIEIKELETTIEEEVQSKVVVAKKSNNKSHNKSSSKVHKIKKGDTLGAIASKYKTTVSAICHLNSISKTTILKLNSSLKISN